MKKLFYSITIIALFIFIGCSSVQEHPSGDRVAFEVGAIAPNFTGRDLDGNEYELWEMEGKKVILSFWATYDGRSRLQLDDLQAFYNNMDEDKIVLLGITFKEEEGDIIPLLSRRRINYPNIIDRRGDIGRLYGISIIEKVDDFGRMIIDPDSARNFPLTVFINEESRIERILSRQINIGVLEDFAGN